MTDDTPVWVIFREGIYRHECLGIFSSKELALAEAEDATKREPDSRHEIQVVEFRVNRSTPVCGNFDHFGNPPYKESEPVAVFKGEP